MGGKQSEPGMPWAIYLDDMSLYYLDRMVLGFGAVVSTSVPRRLLPGRCSQCHGNSVGADDHALLEFGWFRLAALEHSIHDIEFGNEPLREQPGSDQCGDIYLVPRQTAGRGRDIEDRVWHGWHDPVGRFRGRG